MNYQEIGNFIQQKRKEKNLTQKQLSEKLGVTDRAISKWERGQGCPDVSILEILSKELGCSILELLKGREIENEVISITEADDYVRGSMNISKQLTKEKMIRFLNQVLVGLIVFLFILLFYFNVVQILYVQKEYKLYVHRDQYRKVHEKIESIEKNLDMIQNHKGIYSSEDYEEIINHLNHSYTSIQTDKIYEYLWNQKEVSYTVNEVYQFFDVNEVLSAQLAIIRILEKYEKKDIILGYREVITDGYFSSLTTHGLKTYTSYQYKINPFSGEKDFYYIENQEIMSAIYNIQSKLSQLDYITKIIIEVGDIHE